MSELKSVECKECHEYSGVYDGLCGNCILKIGKMPEDFDEGLMLRKRIREREEREGKFKYDELELARLEVREQRAEPLPGMRKVPTD